MVAAEPPTPGTQGCLLAGNGGQQAPGADCACVGPQGDCLCDGPGCTASIPAPIPSLVHQPPIYTFLLRCQNWVLWLASQALTGTDAWICQAYDKCHLWQSLPRSWGSIALQVHHSQHGHHCLCTPEGTLKSGAGAPNRPSPGLMATCQLPGSYLPWAPTVTGPRSPHLGIVPSRKGFQC